MQPHSRVMMVMMLMMSRRRRRMDVEGGVKGRRV